MSRFVIALLFFFSLGFFAPKIIESTKNDIATSQLEEKTWTEWA